MHVKETVNKTYLFFFASFAHACTVLPRLYQSMPFLMFAIKSGNGRGFLPESLKQPINTYVAGWTVNQEKNILRIILYPQAMVTL